MDQPLPLNVMLLLNSDIYMVLGIAISSICLVSFVYTTYE